MMGVQRSNTSVSERVGGIVSPICEATQNSEVCKHHPGSTFCLQNGKTNDDNDNNNRKFTTAFDFREMSLNL